MGEMEKTGEWYLSTTYNDAKKIIRINIRGMAKNFITVGFYLKHIRDNRMYEEDGYASIWDFADDQYGISRSTASRWMSMNDRFSENGNSPNLADAYKDFGKSQLQEMLYLPDDKLEEVTADMTVKEIRQIREPEKPEPENPDPENSDPEEELHEEPGPARCITGKSGSGLCGAAAYCSEPVKCCAVCDKSCNGRCGWLDEPADPVNNVPPEVSIDDLDLPIHTYTKLKKAGIDTVMQLQDMSPTQIAAIRGIGCRDVGNIKKALEDYSEVDDCATSHIEAPEKYSDPEPETENAAEMQQESEERCEIAAETEETPDNKQREFDAWPPELSDIPVPSLTAVDDILEEQERSLKDYLACDGLPKMTVLKEQLITGGLRIIRNLVGDVLETDEDEPEEPTQPELPVMRNNDQRKAFLDSYQTWPIWFEVPEASEVYYRYNLPDGTSIVIREYHMWLDWKEKYSDQDPHNIGTREYLLKPGYHYLYDCLTNRTALVEKLKEVQKK